MILTMAEIKARSILKQAHRVKPGAWWFSAVVNLRFSAVSEDLSVVYPVPAGAYFSSRLSSSRVFISRAGVTCGKVPGLWTLRFCADSGEIACGDLYSLQPGGRSCGGPLFLQNSNYHRATSED